MSRTSNLEVVLRLFVALLVACLVLFGAALTARAQTRGPQGEILTPRLVLARLCAHEASLPFGIDSDGDGEPEWVSVRDHRTVWGHDCWLLGEVLLRGAERMDPSVPLETRYVQYAVAYSHGRILEPSERDPNRWATYLMPGPTRPRFWPRARWFSAGWHYAWALAGRIVEMSLDELLAARPFSCDGPVHDWGSTSDGSWARAHGRVEVRCEGARLANHAYARPWLSR